MASTRDKAGRPVVVVTGMGVVTPLGAGKDENWTKLAAGQSGIKTITRFPIEGLKTKIAGAIDFVPARMALARSPERLILWLNHECACQPLGRHAPPHRTPARPFRRRIHPRGTIRRFAGT